MRYLFLLYGDPAGEAALTPDERRALVDGHLALGRELAAAGTLQVAAALGDGVRVLHGDGTVTDGPSDARWSSRRSAGPAETKEHIGSVYLADCADASAALALARRMPASPGLTVEIREILEV